MKRLEPTLIYEMQAARSRSTFTEKVRDAASALSTPKAPRIYADVLAQYGRAAVATATAATILHEPERHEPNHVLWATEVLDAAHLGRKGFAFNDGLHPCRIDEYAGPFMDGTLVE